MHELDLPPPRLRWLVPAVPEVEQVPASGDQLVPGVTEHLVCNGTFRLPALGGKGPGSYYWELASTFPVSQRRGQERMWIENGVSRERCGHLFIQIHFDLFAPKELVKLYCMPSHANRNLECPVRIWEGRGILNCGGDAGSLTACTCPSTHRPCRNFVDALVSGLGAMRGPAPRVHGNSTDNGEHSIFAGASSLTADLRIERVS